VFTQRPGADALILAVPLVVPVGMRVLFGVLTRRLGARRGYLTGFAVYWSGCYLVPLALLGRRRVWALLALLIPPLGAVGTELLPTLRQADPALVTTAGVVRRSTRPARSCCGGGCSWQRSLRMWSAAGCGPPSASPSGTWHRRPCGHPGRAGHSWSGPPSSAAGSDGSRGARARCAGPCQPISSPTPAGYRPPSSGWTANRRPGNAHRLPASANASW
jgi:hypothetical protein